ncbi:MAG: hypothetical protein K6F61_03750 [Clostridiales bacterium]|nr:hypothetical protein [Clostridiales bacterium]
MDNAGKPRLRVSRSLVTLLRNLFFYALVPGLLLWLLARPIGNAVRGSGTAAFLILPAALIAVILNWLVYKMIRRKLPSLLVFSHGVLCLLAVVFVEHDSLPGSSALTSALALIAGFLALMCLLLSAFWFAGRNTRLTRVIAVGLRIVVGVILFFMAYQIIRDIECKNVTRDTWITLAIMVVTVLVRFAPRILSALRRKGAENRATGLAEGRIVQILGETHLDLDNDPVTLQHVRVQYTVDGVPYETRGGITRYAIRKFGKAALVGRIIPVSYDPANPSDAHVKQIDMHFFDDNPQPPSEEASGEEPADQADS